LTGYTEHLEKDCSQTSNTLIMVLRMQHVPSIQVMPEE